MQFPVSARVNLRTSDLKWETTNQTNIGLDLTVLNNRLTFSMDYYYKKNYRHVDECKSACGRRQPPASPVTKADDQQRDSRFAINSHNLTGEFSWDTDFNISFNKNKLTKLSFENLSRSKAVLRWWKENIVRTARTSLGGFYGYISDGVDPETGNLIYRDLNVTKTAKISADRTYIGDLEPRLHLRIDKHLAHGKDLRSSSLSIFIQEGMYGKNHNFLENVITYGNIEGLFYRRVKRHFISYNIRCRQFRNGVSAHCAHGMPATLLTWTS